ncbi:hypothetical protein NSA50_19460 [Clostridium sp. DSM 100503]|uniref:DUF6414 family protein n=1 Tax=Clostridium sp. DSM 100503 TaxID=2963282 RepID=UPI00214A862D|nr:hypothetical protein [Clostridium sp. DSM 100503]MCR1953166.1 hypothetical protein [Clostridium sp. DSM 100503]
MKHFIYLDTDVLNSYLSQINDGLIKNTVNEAADEIASSKEESSLPGKSRFSSELGFKGVFNMKFSEDKDVINTTNTLSQIESGRELIEKVLHDNAFEQLRKYLNKEFRLRDIKECEIGDYVEVAEKYTIRDLDYIINIYTDEFIEFMGDNGIKEYEKEKTANGNVDTIKLSNKMKEEKRKAIIKEQRETKRIFYIARNIMPFSKFLLCDGYIIPLNDKFLRESTQKIRFNYSGKIKILGRFTSTIEEAVKREKCIEDTFNTGYSSFDEIYSSLDTVLETTYTDILGINKNSKIIEPIALYFE